MQIPNITTNTKLPIKTHALTICQMRKFQISKSQSPKYPITSNRIISKFAHEATSSSSSPSTPKTIEQPQSLSSSGNDSVLNAVDGDADGIDDKSLTNGKGDDSVAESASYQNADIIRTSHASNSDAEYENTMQNKAESNGLNGSKSNVSDAATSAVDATTNNNNVAKCELVNGNANEAAKKSDDNLNAAASKDQLYDVPVGEFHIYPSLSHSITITLCPSRAHLSFHSLYISDVQHENLHSIR